MVDLFPTGEENPFFPNQGGFFEDFGISDHWNVGVPAIGVNPARLEVQTFGESRPIVADEISVSRRKSRRVVFIAKQ